MRLFSKYKSKKNVYKFKMKVTLIITNSTCIFLCYAMSKLQHDTGLRVSHCFCVSVTVKSNDPWFCLV